MRAAQGQKEPPNEGTTTDIDAVAHLLPYCDAIFMDNGCRSLLLDAPTALRPTETAKVFSSNSKHSSLTICAPFGTAYLPSMSGQSAKCTKMPI